VLVAESRRPGPVVWLTACIHGDEVGGTAIVHDVFARLRKEGLSRGAVHAFPLINSMGFENVSRYINTDREDLNRCFPIARRLYDTIMKSEPSLVIDLHNDWIQSIPYILLDPPQAYPNARTERRTLELARATGLPLVEDSDVFHPLRNTLAGAIVDAGVPAFTIEAGGAYAVVEKGVVAGRDAVLSTLHSMEMIDWFLPAGHPGTGAALRYTNRPLCSTSGLIRFDVHPGQEIRKGQVLAQVFSAFGSREEALLATADGFVLGLEDHARVLPGREVIAVAERS
jgi:predicted deacylase